MEKKCKNNQPHELLKMIGDAIRDEGAHVLANEYEAGEVSLHYVASRLPAIASKLFALAESLTIIGRYSEYTYIGKPPRASVRAG